MSSEEWMEGGREGGREGVSVFKGRKSAEAIGGARNDKRGRRS